MVEERTEDFTEGFTAESVLLLVENEFAGVLEVEEEAESKTDDELPDGGA